MGFSFRITKVISPYQLTTFFNMGFHLVLKGLLMSEIVVVKDYTNEILKFKIMSTWITYKNMLGFAKMSSL